MTSRCVCVSRPLVLVRSDPRRRGCLIEAMMSRAARRPRGREGTRGRSKCRTDRAHVLTTAVSSSRSRRPINCSRNCSMNEVLQRSHRTCCGRCAAAGALSCMRETQVESPRSPDDCSTPVVFVGSGTSRDVRAALEELGADRPGVGAVPDERSHGAESLTDGTPGDAPLVAFFDQHRLGTQFRRRYLLLIVAEIWSSGTRDGGTSRLLTAGPVSLDLLRQPAPAGRAQPLVVAHH